MNARHWLITHPQIYLKVEEMRKDGLTTDTIIGIIRDVLEGWLPSRSLRDDVIRILSHALKQSEKENPSR